MVLSVLWSFQNLLTLVRFTMFGLVSFGGLLFVLGEWERAEGCGWAE